MDQPGFQLTRLAASLTLAAILAAVMLIAFVRPAFTFAAPNPSGTGQPNVECGEEDTLAQPPGFFGDGFALAQTVYAGEGASADHSGSPEHAVSQYDVACFELSSHS